MSTTIPATEARLPPGGTSLIPDAHEVELAARSRQALQLLAEATGDLTLTISGAEGATEGTNSGVRGSAAIRGAFADGLRQWDIPASA